MRRTCCYGTDQRIERGRGRERGKDGETPPQSGRWKLTCTPTHSHIVTQGIAMQKRVLWCFARTACQNGNEWKQSSVQITSRKTEGSSKFALMRTRGTERARELPARPGLYYKTNKPKQELELELEAAGRFLQLNSSFSTFTSAGAGSSSPAHSAFNLSFILIAVDDDKDNDDDGVSVGIGAHLLHRPHLDVRLSVYTSECRLILISIWHSCLTRTTTELRWCSWFAPYSQLLNEPSHNWNFKCPRRANKNIVWLPAKLSCAQP